MGSLHIDELGVRLHGLMGETVIPWHELQAVSMEKKDRGTKYLILKAEGEEIWLGEAVTKSTKKEIASLLEMHAPQQWKDSLRENISQWI